MATSPGNFPDPAVPGPAAPARVLVVPGPAVSPEAVFAVLQERPGCFWLDSSGAGGTGRFSIMGCEPFGVFRSWGHTCRFESGGNIIVDTSGDPLEQLEFWLRQFRIAARPAEELPFAGGAVGFLSYDLGAVIEPAARPCQPDATQAPDLHLAWYDAAVVWDHLAGRTWLVGVGWRRPPETAVNGLRELLARATRHPPALSARGEPVTFASNFPHGEYAAAVRKVKERIAAGEIYQMNLAQRFSCALREPPAVVYSRLRQLNPAPMACYLAAGEWTLLSSSPERFFCVEEGGIRTFPIKGTRPRGRDAAEDAVMRAELCASEKERAELLMIVDLLRNDLGRVCRYGTVRVEELARPETFATVHHLVAEVSGQLRPDTGPAAVLRAMFPGGSITGAPKIRAMQVIGELEPDRRGIFSGAIGCWSACGRTDLSIAIRTIVCRGNRAEFHVGAGIVWDSDPLAEYEETLAKGEALFAALGGAPAGARKEIRNGRTVAGGAPAPEPAEAKGVFETLRLRGGLPAFFDEHARRFAAGGAYYGLSGAPDADILRNASVALARLNGIGDGVLRWSVWRGDDGHLQWRIATEPVRPHMLKGVWRAALAPARLPRARPDRHCKKLQRKIWRDALREARALGFDEALLADEEGNLVEGAISNLFVVRDGRLLTPPLADGPLPGTARAEALRLAASIGLPAVEATLMADDLTAAEEVFVTNALVGLRPLAAVGERSLSAPGPVTVRLQSAWRAAHGWL